jgi:hypothetical protein
MRAVAHSHPVLIVDGRPEAHHGRVLQPAPVLVGEATTGPHDELKVRLDRETGHHLGLVGRLDHHLAAADRPGALAEQDRVAVEGPGRGADARVDHPERRGVVGPARQQALIGDAAIEVEIDQVAVARDLGDPQEGAGALVLGIGLAVERLVDDAVDAAVAAEAPGDAARLRVGQEPAGDAVEARAVEAAEMLPAAQRRGAVQVLAPQVQRVGIRDLADQQRRIADPEAGAAWNDRCGSGTYFTRTAGVASG